MSHITSNSGTHSLPTPRPHRLPVYGHTTPSSPAPAPKLTSKIRKAGKVTFPEFTEERVYMQPFLKTCGEVLLPKLLWRWLTTVTAMLEGIECKEPMFLMIDQSKVVAGSPHRRPGPHIDGNWSEKKAPFNPNELLILASDVMGCAAYLGSYHANHVGKGGDCSTIDLKAFDYMPLLANYAYIGTAATIHESLPVKQDCNRTLVRINVPQS